MDVIDKVGKIYCGDALEVLKTLPDKSIQCCVTSPPYFHLRDYNTDGQIGMESTLQEYIARLVIVFHEVRRVLADDGTLWVNIADCYGQNFRWGNKGNASEKQRSNKGSIRFMCCPEYEPAVSNKSLMGIPWRLAFALQDDGWILRQDIIWNKTNCMPESVKDRCTKSHEYIFLLAKKPKYYYDSEAIAEPVSGENQLPVAGSLFMPQSRRRGSGNQERKVRQFPGATKNGFAGNVPYEYEYGKTKNKRSVWNFSTSRGAKGHFATFPETLPKTCILAGS